MAAITAANGIPFQQQSTRWPCTGRLHLVGEEVEIQQLAAPGISLCTALKDGAATAGTSSPEGTNQPCAAGSVPVLSAFIVGMLGRRRALSGGTPRAMLYNIIMYSGLS